MVKKKVVEKWCEADEYNSEIRKLVKRHPVYKDCLMGFTMLMVAVAFLVVALIIVGNQAHENIDSYVDSYVDTLDHLMDEFCRASGHGLKYSADFDDETFRARVIECSDGFMIHLED